MRTRETAEMAMSSGTSMAASSPHVAKGNETAREVKRRKRKKKGAEKRAVTIAKQNAARIERREAELRAAVQDNIATQMRTEQEAAEKKARCFDVILATLKREGYTWGDLVEWIARPSSDRSLARWEGLFRNGKQVKRILDLWAWKNSPDSRVHVKNWAIQYMGKLVSEEAQAVTQSNILQTRSLDLDDNFLRSFDLASIHDRIRGLCPAMTSVLRMFSTTHRQWKALEKNNHTAEGRERIVKQLDRTNTVSNIPITYLTLFLFGDAEGRCGNG